MPADRAPDDAGEDEHLDAARPRRDEAGGDREADAEEQHHLPAVAITERAEPQHRGRQTERVPDGDEVELRLRRVERDADVGKRHVRDGEVQVGDGRHQDERKQHHPAAGGSG